MTEECKRDYVDALATIGTGSGGDADDFAQRFSSPGSPTTLSINDVTQAEGDNETTICTFTATRLGDTSNTSTVYDETRSRGGGGHGGRNQRLAARTLSTTGRPRETPRSTS